MSSRRKYVVGIGGTTRPGSSSERLVSAVLTELQHYGIETELFNGSHLARLPIFDTEYVERNEDQTALISAVRGASALVIGTPGYHGGMSGLIKNAIDLLEDTSADVRQYFDGMPVGLVVSAAGWQACGTTMSAARDIVHAMRGWPTPLGICVNTAAQRLFDDGGALTDQPTLGAVTMQARQIAQFLRLA